MRGEANQQATMLTAITPDAKVPQDHPVRAIKPTVDRALLDLWPVFNAMYANVGRPSMPPEHLLKAQLLMPLFSVPSARRLSEQLEYNLLFKWFLDRNVDDPAFDASTFSKNQERLLQHNVARQFVVLRIHTSRWPSRPPLGVTQVSELIQTADGLPQSRRERGGLFGEGRDVSAEAW